MWSPFFWNANHCKSPSSFSLPYGKWGLGYKHSGYCCSCEQQILFSNPGDSHLMQPWCFASLTCSLASRWDLGPLVVFDEVCWCHLMCVLPKSTPQLWPPNMPTEQASIAACGWDEMLWTNSTQKRYCALPLGPDILLVKVNTGDGPGTTSKPVGRCYGI